MDPNSDSCRRQSHQIKHECLISDQTLEVNILSSTIEQLILI